ncbi:MAG: DUF5675 family protein [Pseudodesulfovibrio sp.]|uniref:DUF5675 family protein n=1 Tax=Pseudodesulfovibrio sp. TaxID=2035812 RepID=UPI003D0BE84F
MVREITIHRIEKSDAGTFGVLSMDGLVFCLTLEPPDRNNAVGRSCIPEGTYTCRRVDSPTFGPTFEVADVPGRTAILFHQGNVTRDTHGCVLLGRRFGVLNGERGILTSKQTLVEFLARMDCESCFLHVADVSEV